MARRLWLLAVLLVLAGASVGIWSYLRCHETGVREAVRSQDTMAWLRAEFCLSEAQYEKLRVLHAEHAQACDEHCRLVREARAELQRLRAAGADTTVLNAAELRASEAAVVCEQSTLAHIRRCAAEMDPEQGRRYEELMQAQLRKFKHDGPAALSPEKPANPEHRHGKRP